jgi:hypothetical protein
MHTTKGEEAGDRVGSDDCVLMTIECQHAETIYLAPLDLTSE